MKNGKHESNIPVLLSYTVLCCKEHDKKRYTYQEEGVFPWIR